MKSHVFTVDDHNAYQSDYSHKVESSIALLTELGFVSRHAEELL